MDPGARGCPGESEEPAIDDPGLRWLRLRLDRIEEKLDGLAAMLSRSFPRDGTSLKPCHVNISGCGMRFPAPERFETGDRLEVVVVLPILPHHGVRLVGEVVHVLDPAEHCPGADQDARFDTALRFENIQETDRERIIRYSLHQQANRIQREREQL
jgi:hypothetical protein